MEDRGMYEIPVQNESSSPGFVGRIKQLLSFSYNSLVVVVTVFSILIMVYVTTVTPHQIDGNSMHPTYVNKEYLIALKIAYNISEPQHGDVVIFEYSNSRDFIKRIVGLPGDTISLRSGDLYRNGVLIDESAYLDSSVVTNEGRSLKEGGSVYVDEGKVFVVGDNRPHSADSRAFGTIDQAQIKGRAIWVIYPLGNIRQAI